MYIYVCVSLCVSVWCVCVSLCVSVWCVCVCLCVGGCVCVCVCECVCGLVGMCVSVNHIYNCNFDVQPMKIPISNNHQFIWYFLYDILGDPTIIFAIYWVNLSYDILGEVYDILGEFATYWERFATYWEITTYREGCDILGLYKVAIFALFMGLGTYSCKIYRKIKKKLPQGCK